MAKLTPSVLCLENPKDGGPWWAVVWGHTEVGPRLDGTSSSSEYLLGRSDSKLPSFPQSPFINLSQESFSIQRLEFALSELTQSKRDGEILGYQSFPVHEINRRKLGINSQTADTMK